MIQYGKNFDFKFHHFARISIKKMFAFGFMFLSFQSVFATEKLIKFPITPMARLHQSIENYLKAENGGYFELKDDLASVRGSSAFVPIIEALTSIMNRHDSLSQRKTAQLLNILAAEMRKSPLTPENRTVFYKILVPVLERFGDESWRAHKEIIRIFIEQQLWTQNELSLLLGVAKQSIDILSYYEGFLLIGKMIDPIDLERLHLALSKTRFPNLPPLLIQYKLGTLTTSQTQDFLKHLELLFRPPGFDLQTDLELPKSLTRLRDLSLDVLEELQQRYISGDQTIINAVEAEKNITRDRHSVFFYSLFAQGDYKNLKQRFPDISDALNHDPLAIASRLATQHELVTGLNSRIRERQGNLMRLDFSNKCIDFFKFK